MTVKEYLWYNCRTFKHRTAKLRQIKLPEDFLSPFIFIPNLSVTVLIKTEEGVIVRFSDVTDNKIGKQDTAYFKLPISKVPNMIYQFVLLNRQLKWL